jgi:hypothetical protein
MFVSAVNSIRGSSPVKKTEKTAKVTKGLVAKADDHTRKPAKSPAKEASRRDPQAAPKSPEAMSSSAVQAALTFLRPGG